MASSLFPLLVLYDDSLHNRWTARPQLGCSLNLTAAPDVGRHTTGQLVPCGHSLTVQFGASTGSAMVLDADEPVVLINVSIPLVLSFAFVLSPWPAPEQSCLAQASQGQCNAAVCVGLRQQGTNHSQTTYIPLCGKDAFGVAERTLHGHRHKMPSRVIDWRQQRIPLSQFGVASSFDQLIFTTGLTNPNLSSRSLWLDELWIAADRSPIAGDTPPSYGRSDMNVVKSNWVQGVRMGGSANSARSNRNPHFCEYMSSELAHTHHSGTRHACKMDGDHLSGRWMQTCDPRLIARPDHFAYGRALPAVQGWYDYRICYRQSATERLRSLQALSWSWRPFNCALSPVNGHAFDEWLGSRKILFLGDSLNAQTYYSLLWLMGDVVVDQYDLYGYTPYEVEKGTGARSEVRVAKCQTTAGNEGGFVSKAHLRSGGILIKVLRHTELVDELHRIKQAFWSHWAVDADFIILNVGHHYHAVDASFQGYRQMAKVATRQFERLMKPSAQLIFRTTNIGHHSCETATRPLKSRREAWQQLTGSSDIWGWHPRQSGMNAVDMFRDKYNWRGPPLFEGSWADALKQTPLLQERFTYLNVSFLDARADGHVATSMRYSSSKGTFGSKQKTEFPLDCLHYCYPGPSDYWALSLYNLLLNNPKFHTQPTG